MHVYLGEIIMALGIAVMIGGLVGLIRFHTFYRRLLVGSLIDTAGMLLFLLGAVIRQGFTEFSLKLLLIMAAVILTAPLVTHKLGRSAYLSGHREDAVEHTDAAAGSELSAAERAEAAVCPSASEFIGPQAGEEATDD